MVESWMTRGVIAIAATARVHEAVEQLASRRIRRLVVMDHGHLVGIVTKTDLQHAGPDEPVSALMSHDVITVTSATPLEDAAKLMIDRKIGALPVVDARGVPVGILTESDAMRALIASIAIPGPGVRLTLRAPDPDAVIRFVVDAARHHHMTVLSLLVTGIDDERRVLAKLAGARVDAVVADLWRAGHCVMSTHRL